MFTGLIQGLGSVQRVEPMGEETRLRIRPLFELKDYVLGESIAVNGACLTVETFGPDWFTAYASAETMSRTSLGKLKPGSHANLERALALGDRLGGHMVSGHVDCQATVKSVSPAGQSRIYTLEFPAEFGPQVVPKGSVALDGISLTINECGQDWLSVNIIPKTQNATTIGQWSPGYSCNMETDLIGKYVLRSLEAWRNAGDRPASGTKSSGLTEELLRQYGY